MSLATTERALQLEAGAMAKLKEFNADHPDYRLLRMMLVQLGDAIAALGQSLIEDEVFLSTPPAHRRVGSPGPVGREP